MSQIRTVWALAFGFLFIAGRAYAEERPTFRETARVTLHQWGSQTGQWQHRPGPVGDYDVATTQIWISQDGDVSAGSSWSTGETPAEWGATDLVLVDGVASQVSMTSGLDQSAIAFYRMDVTDDFMGDLGLPGTPLKFAGVNIITMRGSGTLHYEPTGGAIFVDSPNHLNALSMPSGILIDTYVTQGHVDIGAAAIFTPNDAILATFGPYATVTVAGSGNTAPAYVQCHDGRIDLGLRGPAAVNYQIEVAGGHLILHRLTGTVNYAELRQTGGRIDFDILEANGVALRAQFAGGIADFRKCQYVFSTFSSRSYIGPGVQIIPGPATNEAIIAASGILDFRGVYP